MSQYARLVVLALALVAWPAGLARAHPLMPAALSIVEHAPARYEVTFRRSALLARELSLDLPAGCTRGRAQPPRTDDPVIDRFELTCTRSLEGQLVRVQGLVALQASAMVHVALRSGDEARVLLSASRPGFEVPRRSTPLSVLRDYLALGVEHLVTGLDHVLFLVGLMLLVPGVRRQLWSLTAFTLGHSATLCLSALAIIDLPERPVEVGIAASLVVLALELLRVRGGQGQSAGRPWLMAAGFGLLHGLGFASALGETGLPPRAVALSLLGFNFGVELGQLAVVLALAPLLALARRLPDAGVLRLHGLAAYALGALAAMWCLERALPI